MEKRMATSILGLYGVKGYIGDIYIYIESIENTMETLGVTGVISPKP